MMHWHVLDLGYRWNMVSVALHAVTKCYAGTGSGFELSLALFI